MVRGDIFRYYIQRDRRHDQVLSELRGAPSKPLRQKFPRRSIRISEPIHCREVRNEPLRHQVVSDDSHLQWQLPRGPQEMLPQGIRGGRTARGHVVPHDKTQHVSYMPGNRPGRPDLSGVRHEIPIQG